MCTETRAPVRGLPTPRAHVGGDRLTASMQLEELPPDPFDGMSPAERKRAQEAAILEMAYDLTAYHAVGPGERPDFTLSRFESSTQFGVEITQLFPNESIA